METIVVVVVVTVGRDIVRLVYTACSCQAMSSQASSRVDQVVVSEKQRSTLSERRRSSLKAMRQCRSLPHPASGSTLRMLIESRVRLPTCSPSVSRYRQQRDAAMTAAERDDFFLEIVRDVSCELGLTRLTRKMLANLAALASAQSVNIYMLEAASASWSVADGRRPRLVSRSYDARDGLDDEQRYSLVTDDASTATAPWSYALIGYVAETAVVVRLAGNASNTVSNLFLCFHSAVRS